MIGIVNLQWLLIHRNLPLLCDDSKMSTFFLAGHGTLLVWILWFRFVILLKISVYTTISAHFLKEFPECYVRSDALNRLDIIAKNPNMKSENANIFSFRGTSRAGGNESSPDLVPQDSTSLNSDWLILFSAILFWQRSRPEPFDTSRSDGLFEFVSIWSDPKRFYFTSQWTFLELKARSHSNAGRF